MGFNIGDFGGALAGAISKDLRAQREEREAKQKKQLDEHSEAVNIAKKKLKPIFLQDLEKKVQEISVEFESLKIPISKTTVYKIATEGYKDFQTLKQDSPAKLYQYAGTAAEDPSFDLQQAIELAAEERATKDIAPFMPFEERSFLGFKTSSGERKIEREAKRLGMTAEEYKEYGSGAISAPQVDVTLDRSVLSDVTDKEMREQKTANLTRALLLPDSERKKKIIKQSREQLALLPKAKGKVTQADVRANLKFAMAGVEEQLVADNLGKNIPGEGFVLNYQITPDQARKAGEEYQRGVRFLLNDYLRANGIKPTNNIQNDINQLPDEIRQPFLSAMPQFTMSTLQNLARNRSPVTLPSQGGQKNYSIGGKQNIQINPRFSGSG